MGALKDTAKSAVADDQDVAVFDDVLLALQAELAFFASAGVAAEIDQRLPVHHFGTDELLLEIGVDAPAARTAGV